MTVPVLLVRHGRTAWNDARRIQGHTDVPLSSAGQVELAGRRIPPRYRAWTWYTSPLGRARETARALGVADPAVDDRLRELDWGEWEGRTRDEVRAVDRAGVRANEARGIDFRPPGGESSRELRDRLRAWLGAVTAQGSPVAAVTHKGVVQMALAMATGWDLVGSRPHRLRWDCAHLFAYARDEGRLAVARLDIELVAE